MATPMLLGRRKRAPASGGGLAIHDEELVCYVDAGIASSYGGTGTTWTDLSSQGNNHTWNVAPAHTSGSAGYFTCLTSSPGPHNTTGLTTGFSTAAATWSVDIRFYLASVGPWTGMWWLGTNSTNQGLWLGVNDGSQLYIETSNGTQILGGAMTASTWYSVHVEYTGTNLVIFVNNTQQANTAFTLNLTLGDFRVATSNADFNDLYGGRIAGVIVYGDVLTPAERLINYNEFTSRY